MASLCNDPNGRKRLVFKNPAGKRVPIRLGKVSQQDAEMFRYRVEAILIAKAMGRPPDLDTARWLSSISNQMYDRLARAGLVERRTTRSIGELIQSFRELCDSEHEDSTKENFRVLYTNLQAFFGSERQIAEITPVDAKRFRSWLKDHGGRNGRALAVATVSRRCRRAKQIFHHAVESRWLTKSPFHGMKGWNEVNRRRDFLVSRDVASRILDAIPDAEFRAMFSFVRFCGMRCPSEVRPFEWEQVNWETGALVVLAPKTKRHENREQRTVPMFGPTRMYLEELWEQCPDGESLLFRSHQVEGASITDKLERICRSIGILLWQKPWVNLRSTCESELLEEHPIQNVASWLGHSPTIALRHYLQIVKEQDVRSAAKNQHHGLSTSKRKGRS